VAKGATAEDTAATFTRIRLLARWYGYAAGSFDRHLPLSPLISGVVGLKDQELRLWCFSTVMLHYVGEGIEAGDIDADARLADARRLCDIDPEHFARDAVQSFATEYAADWFSHPFRRAVGSRADELGRAITPYGPPLGPAAGFSFDVARGESPMGQAFERAIATTLFGATASP
jgi:hypothetical protein